MAGNKGQGDAAIQGQDFPGIGMAMQTMHLPKKDELQTQNE
jgi:hypothetical protein